MRARPVILAFLAAASLAGPSVAQRVLPFDGPVRDAGRWGFDATGALVPVDAPLEGTTAAFANVALNGAFVVPAPGDRVMDWGVLADAPSEKVTSIGVGYATTATEPSLVLVLHDGATGNGDDGSPSTALLLSSLPGSPDGTPTAYVASIDPPLGLTWDEGPFGWSFESLDGETGPLLVGLPVEDGVVDAYDVYRPDGLGSKLYAATVSMGGDPFASFYLELAFDDDLGFTTFGTSSAPAVQVKGDGSGLPGENVAVIVKGYAGTTATLVIGTTPSDVVGAGGLTFYTLPLLTVIPEIEFGPFAQTMFVSTIPPDAPVGAQLVFQSFSPNLIDGALEHSNGLILTVESLGNP